MALSFTLQGNDIGGQAPPNPNLDLGTVVAGDIIWVAATTNSGAPSINIDEASNVRLIEARAGLTNQLIKAWQVETGYTDVDVTTSGPGSNEDTMGLVARPSHPISPDKLETALASGSGHRDAQMAVVVGDLIIICQYSTGQTLRQPAIKTGVTFNSWIAALPEGATGTGNAYMEAISITSAGTLNVNGANPFIAKLGLPDADNLVVMLIPL